MVAIETILHSTFPLNCTKTSFVIHTSLFFFVQSKRKGVVLVVGSTEK